MSKSKRERNQGEGDRVSDRKYREDVQRFLRRHDPAAIARKAAAELDDEDERQTRPFRRTSGKIGWALLWLLGIPLPVLIIIYLIRGH